MQSSGRWGELGGAACIAAGLFCGALLVFADFLFFFAARLTLRRRALPQPATTVTPRTCTRAACRFPATQSATLPRLLHPPFLPSSPHRRRLPTRSSLWGPTTCPPATRTTPTSWSKTPLRELPAFLSGDMSPPPTHFHLTFLHCRKGPRRCRHRRLPVHWLRGSAAVVVAARDAPRGAAPLRRRRRAHLPAGIGDTPRARAAFRPSHPFADMPTSFYFQIGARVSGAAGPPVPARAVRWAQQRAARRDDAAVGASGAFLGPHLQVFNFSLTF